jgi:hypothetical protein
MAAQVQCPNPACARKCSLADGATGRPVRCPHCGTRFATATRGPNPSSAPDYPPPSASESTPTRVARFEVRALLGEGAFGRVFRAHDPQLDREVALKVPHPSTLASPRAVERFLREARAASRLRHPHIVPIHDAGRDGSHLYIASAFIEGTTLENAIDEESLDDQAAARVVRELAEALAYAHEQGIIHRDIKPANVLLDQAGHAHLADFGLAHRQDSTDKITHDGAVIGTPAYMAPEQARGRAGEVMPASDQYALGVVLYELLTGRVPFSGPVALVLSMQVNQEPPAPHTIRPYVPVDLETICLNALSKRPQERYADCQEMADDLWRWLDGEPIRARPLSAWEWLVRWCRRNPLLAGACGVAAAALLLALVLASSFAYTQGSHSRKLRVERDAAEAARKELDKQNKDLEEAQVRKEKSLQAEKRATEEARREKQVAERYLYAAHMHLAYQAWEEVDTPQLLDLLEQWRPKGSGGRDFRGWEWHFPGLMGQDVSEGLGRANGERSLHSQGGHQVARRLPSGLYATLRVARGCILGSPSRRHCDAHGSSVPARLMAVSVQGGLVLAGDGRGDAAARRERADDPAAARLAGGHEVVEQAVDDRFVERTLVAIALQVELEGLQLHAAGGRGVGEGDGAEVRLARLGAQAGELGADDLDGVIAAGLGVGERLQLPGRRRFRLRHDSSSSGRHSTADDPATRPSL